uniref:Minor tail protein n=1 Tax=Siphoviridae sp. ctTwu10 TaxID=2825525 RepID=A0A8S5P8V0_9CAUD|nr:MAG TPA: Minor tail protein [Siphoviridae sp. ctTwu10]
MAEVDNLEIVISAEAQSALSGLEKIKAALGGFKQELSGIDTKKFKESMQSFDDFQKKLQSVGKNTVASDSFVELKRQIEAAEKRLDSLLVREDKLKTVGGVDQNSKSWRNLQYDIAETCNKLDVFYSKMSTIQAAQRRDIENIKIHDWRDNATETPNEGVNTYNTPSMEKCAAAAQSVAQSLGNVTQAAKPAGAAVESLNTDTETGGGKFERLGGILQTASDAFARFRERLSNGNSTAAFNESMQETIDRIQELKHLMGGMEKGTIAFDSTVYENAARTLADCTARMNEYKNSVTGGSEETSRLRSIISGMGSALASFGAKAASVFGKIITKGAQAAHAALSRMKASLPSLGKAFEGVGRKFQIAFMLATLMLLRRAIMALFREMKEGFDALATYSNSVGSEFNKNVSELQANLKSLGHQLVAALEPLLNTVIPILNAFISKLIQAMQAVAQFFAALTGKGTWTRATKNVGNYAAGLSKTGAAAKKTAKEIKNLTTGIDELNILQQESEDEGAGAGGAGGASGLPGFETVPVDPKWANIADRLKSMCENADFTELGALLARLLGNALANIPWDYIRSVCRKIGQSIATFLNGFIEEEIDGHRIAWWIGYTIGQAINSAFEIIYGFAEKIHWDSLGRVFTDGIKGLYDALDWELIDGTFKKIGAGLAEMFNTIFADTDAWTKAGEIVSNSINAVLGGALEFVRNFKFEQFGVAIGTGLSTAFTGINWAGLGEFFGKGISGLFDSIKGFFDAVDWKKCGNSVIDGIGAFFKNIKWSSIAGALSSAVKGLCDLLTGAFKAVNWKELPRYIVDSIADFFAGFDWSGMSKSLGELLGAAVKGAIDLLGSLWSTLKEACGDVKEYFSGYIDKAGGDIVAGLWQGIKGAFANAGKWIMDNIVTPFVDGFKEGFGIHSPSTVMAELAGNLITGIWEGISGAWSEFWSNLSEKWAEIKKGFSDTWENIKSGTSEKWQALKTDVDAKFTALKTALTTTANNIKSMLEQAWNNIKTAASNAWQALKQDVSAKFEALKTALTTTANNIKSTLSSTWDSVKSTASTKWNELKTNVSNLFSGLHDTLKGVSFTDVGSNIVNGIWKGISDGWDWLKKKVKELANSLLDAAKDALGIESPSKAFRDQVGRWIMPGVTEGMERTLPEAIHDIQDISNSLLSSMQRTMGGAVNVGRFVVDDSQLKGYSANYGDYFTDAAITHRVKQEMGLNSNVQAEIDGGRIVEQMKQALDEVVASRLDNMAVDVRRTADKDPRTTVNIGGRVVADEVQRQKSANGFMFTPSFG